MDFLYEAELRDLDPLAIVADRRELAQGPNPEARPVAEYTAQIVTGVAEELDSIDDTIESHLADDWRLDRIAATDRAVLRVSTWELLFNPEVPVKTAVVEGIELAFQYSGPESSAYINAVLDSMSKHVEDLRDDVRKRAERPESSAEGNSESPVSESAAAAVDEQSPEPSTLEQGASDAEERGVDTPEEPRIVLRRYPRPTD